MQPDQHPVRLPSTAVQNMPPVFSKPDGNPLTRVHIPNRDPRLPTLATIAHHAKLPDDLRACLGTIYVWECDTTVEAMASLDEYASKLEALLGPNEEMFNHGTLCTGVSWQDPDAAVVGLLKLTHGDVIFVRDKYVPEEQNDILLGWVLNVYVLSSLLMTATEFHLCS